MFGRIRASPSSLDSIDASPSKLLKHDSLSLYEATLLKLKLGAQRHVSAPSKEIDEIMEHSSSTSSCLEEPNLKPSCNSPVHEEMETDCSSISTAPSFGERVSTGKNSENQRQKNNVSILRFFKPEDAGNSSFSSCGEVASTKDGSSGSVSCGSVESHYRTEMGCSNL